MPDTEIRSCSACSMQNKFPLAAPQVALEVTATDFPPASCMQGQGCTGTWDRVERGCRGLLTQGAASKDKCFSGSTMLSNEDSTVKNILHTLVLSAAETLDTFPPTLMPHHPSSLVPFWSLSLAMSAA